MQPTLLRFTQCIRIALSASKTPIRFQARTIARPRSPCGYQFPQAPARLQQNQARYYSHRASAGGGENRIQKGLDEQKEPDLSSSSSSSSPEPNPISEHGHPTTKSGQTGGQTEAAPDDELPSDSESRRTHLSRRFSHLMDNIQSNIFTASQRLNDLTGYSGIETLKRSIEKQECSVSSTRQAVKAARSAYSAAVATRSTTQREVNDLLQRKQSWSTADLERFTALYRSDHANEQAEQRAQDELARCDRAAEEAGNSLAKSILARYHEEQIWSDKIRQMSTWGTWGLMGVNVLLFLVFQVAVEPWRRRRLVKGFEEKVMEALERERPDSALSSTDTDTPSTPEEEEEEASMENQDPTAAALTAIDAIDPTTTTPPAISPTPTPDPPPPPSSSSSSWLWLWPWPWPWLSQHLPSLSHTHTDITSFLSYPLADHLSTTETVCMTQREASVLVAQAAALGGLVVGVVVVAWIRGV